MDLYYIIRLKVWQYLDSSLAIYPDSYLSPGFDQIRAVPNLQDVNPSLPITLEHVSHISKFIRIWIL
jgi:hypothetical protein